MYECSLMALVVKNTPANAGDTRDVGWIPGSGKSPGGGHGNLLQYSWLVNSMDRGAKQATQSMGSQRVRNDWAHTRILELVAMPSSRGSSWPRDPMSLDPMSLDLPDPGEPMSLVSPALAGRFFTTAPPGKPKI